MWLGCHADDGVQPVMEEGARLNLSRKVGICLGFTCLVLVLVAAVPKVRDGWPGGLSWLAHLATGQSKEPPAQQPTVRLSNILPSWDIQSSSVASSQDARVEAQPTVASRGVMAASRPDGLNGVPTDKIIVMSEATRQRIGEIFTHGQSLGRNPGAMSKVGDSTMIWPPFLAVFDNPASYKLGAYAYLQATIERYAGSFARNSMAVVKGMHTWTEFDATWADQQQCKPGEGPLPCELRLHNPSVAIIRLGTNDAYQPVEFEAGLRRIIEFCMTNGVIPVLATKPDRLEGAENTINQIIYRLAASYQIPLWDYDLVAGTVPGKGLQEDKLHYLGGGTHDYTSPALSWGADSLQDLTALMMLEAVARQLQ